MPAALCTTETEQFTRTERAQLRSAPPLEPPYDDDLVDPSAEPLLGLVPALVRSEELPFERPHRGLRITRKRSNADDMFDPQPTPRAALPDPGRHAAHVLQAMLEVLARRRPLQQLLPWTSEDVYEELTAWHYRTWSRHTAERMSPAVLRSIKVSEPADGVAEITAVIRHGDRARAVVLRLEGIDGRWHCTLLRML
jgi:hypothetical protein